jgi:DNA-directed RNA polymerase subunit H (RpoH/RPB5)
MAEGRRADDGNAPFDLRVRAQIDNAYVRPSDPEFRMCKEAMLNMMVYRGARRQAIIESSVSIVDVEPRCPMLCYADDDVGLVVSLWLHNSKVGISSYRNIVEITARLAPRRSGHSGSVNIVLVVKEVTVFTEKFIQTENARLGEWVTDIQLASRLTQDCALHDDVPLHVKCAPAEVALLKRAMEIDDLAQLPCLSAKDAVCVQMGLRVGDVVRVMRRNGAQPTHAYYRHVCPE